MNNPATKMLETDYEVLTALTYRIRGEDGNDETESLALTLAYGKYHRDKIEYCEEHVRANGKHPTAKELKTWIGSYTETRLSDLITSAIASVEEMIENAIEHIRPELEAVAIEENTNQVLLDIQKRVSRINWKDVLWATISSILAAAIVGGIVFGLHLGDSAGKKEMRQEIIQDLKRQGLYIPEKPDADEPAH